MQDTPKGNRLHIAFLGRRNAGKSSLINALVRQEVAIVSEIPGTTTDPVYKAMEVLPIGPVMFIDTAGIDDEGGLGSLRVERSMGVLSKTDIVILVIPAGESISEQEAFIVRECQRRKIVVVPVISKADVSTDIDTLSSELYELTAVPPLAISARTGEGLSLLIQRLIDQAPCDFERDTIVGDVLDAGDIVVLVVPIDSAAPKGRLILPQVQTIRDVIDHECMAFVVKEDRLADCLASLREKPKLVITDSQVFSQVAAAIPQDVSLTSFSILFARYKGELSVFVEGTEAIKKLRPGDRVLIAEACTHHRQQDDIGTVKIPRWLEEYVGGKLHFEWCSGGTFPENLHSFQLVIHCGACMINRREMLSRIHFCKCQGIPVVNYGITIAFLKGILPRAMSVFVSEREHEYE